MDTLKLTEKDFIKEEYYNKYVGKVDLSSFEGNLEIDECLGWCRFVSLNVSGYIIAKAGTGIKAGEGIEAGWGIKAGLSISCKTILKAELKIFAGICYWREITDSGKTVTCGKLEGKIEYGILNEVGLPEVKQDTIKIVIDGKILNLDRKLASELNQLLDKLIKS